MRPLLAVLLLVLLGACSTTGNGSGAEPRTPTITGSAAPAPGSGGSGGADQDSVCVEVRAGIDDFNSGDYQGTVTHFEKAVPLAMAAADADASQDAQDLLDAVRYYAALAPDDYLEASASSSEFAKYKAITLGQCESPGGAPSTDPGVPI